MNKYIYLLILICLFFLSQPVSVLSDEKGMEINEKQKLLSELLIAREGPIETKWINSYTIDVTYDPGHIEVMTEKEIQNTAETIAKLGYEITKNETCAKISDYKGNELAYKCFGNTPL